jgi:exopolysaccharide biosynthesis protein
MSEHKKVRIWMVLYGSLLIGFSLYVLLDTFVIPRNYIKVEETTAESIIETTKTTSESETEISELETTTSESEESETQTIQEESLITDTSYQDGRVSINIETYREYDTNIYVAEVLLTDASDLKTAFAENTYGRNLTQKTSEIAKEHDAILAINGDFYGAQQDGYVIRNGVVYRENARSNSQEDLVIYPSGSMEIITELQVSAQTLQENGASQVLSFGPSLINAGEITVSKGDEVGKAMASNPRTAIAMIEPLHYLFVVSDGRTSESEGLSLYELATFLNQFDIQCAYNLDGGGSSTMYFNGKVINKPTTRGKSIKERSVSDIVYIQ